MPIPKRTQTARDHHCSVRRDKRAFAAMAALMMALLSSRAHAQLTPAEMTQLQNSIGNRIEALTILGGDYGLAGGTFRSTGKFQVGGNADATLGVTKLGGAGDVGDVKPIGDLGVGWQPRLQGNIGWVQTTNNIHTAPLEGDSSTYNTYALEFGGGARLWASDALSFAPTVMGLYGHTTNSYTAKSAFAQANLARATSLGLIDYTVDTWTFRPALNIQYLLSWNRTIFTLSSDSTYFHTESFNSSNSNVKVKGDSGSQGFTVDVDIPLGVEVYGYELRSGGFINYTALYGGLKTGLATDHLNQIHGRIVLDMLNKIWKVQWFGIGVSYVWGNGISGVTGGIDATFRF
jgi:hypothetical protein